MPDCVTYKILGNLKPRYKTQGMLTSYIVLSINTDELFKCIDNSKWHHLSKKNIITFEVVFSFYILMLRNIIQYHRTSADI